MGRSYSSRRSVLKSALTGSVGISALVAGCPGSNDGDSGTSGDSDTGQVPEGELGDPVGEIDLILYNEGQEPGLNTLGHMVADNMEEVGLQVNRREIPVETFLQVVALEHDFDCVTFAYASSLRRGDPNGFLYEVHHGADQFTGEAGLNSSGYDNPEYNEIVEEQMRTIDGDERESLVHDAQEIIAHDQPYTYVAANDMLQPHRTDTVENVTPSTGGGLASFFTLMEATPIGDTDILRFGQTTEIEGLSLLHPGGANDRLWSGLLFDKLYRIDTEGEPVPWAATDMPTYEDEGRTVVVSLRDDLVFHDGEPIDAEDVKFSYELFGEHSPQFAGVLESVETVEAPAEYEVTFRLDAPFAPFVASSLSQIPIFPKHIWEDIDQPGESRIGDDVPAIGSGPAEFVEWDRTVSLELRAFDDHFQPPAADRLVRATIASSSTAFRMIEQGELDMVGGNPTVSARERLNDDPNIALAEAQGIGWTNIAHNFRREKMRDVHLRRAISYCVPKQRWVQEIQNGVGTVIDTPVSEAYGQWHNPDVEEFRLDLDMARQELTDGGYGWDEGGRLHYSEDFEVTPYLDDS